jgi:hypothetical protein
MATPATKVTSAITVTDPARSILQRHLAASPEHRFIRVHVSRG